MVTNHPFIQTTRDLGPSVAANGWFIHGCALFTSPSLCRRKPKVLLLWLFFTCCQRDFVQLCVFFTVSSNMLTFCYATAHKLPETLAVALQNFDIYWKLGGSWAWSNSMSSLTGLDVAKHKQSGCLKPPRFLQASLEGKNRLYVKRKIRRAGGMV